MDHGYLKPTPPYLTTKGVASTFLLPPDSCAMNITPIELDGAIQPMTMGSEFGAYKIIGRKVSVKRFLHENAQACVHTKGNQNIIVSMWTYDKNAPSPELQMAQTGIGIGKTLASAMKSNMNGGMVGSGIAVKAGANTVKAVYDYVTASTIDLDKVPNGPDSTKFKRFKNALKQVADNVSGQRVAVLVSVLAPPPKVAAKYDTGLSVVTFSNILAVMKGL